MCSFHYGSDISGYTKLYQLDSLLVKSARLFSLIMIIHIIPTIVKKARQSGTSMY